MEQDFVATETQTEKRRPGRPSVYTSAEEAAKANRKRSIVSFRTKQLGKNESYKQVISNYTLDKLFYQKEFLEMKLKIISDRIKEMT